MIYRPILKGGADGATNGGYNFYEVFVKGYLDILMSFVENENLSICCFNKLKRDLFLGFLLSRNYKYLILKQNVVDENMNISIIEKDLKQRGDGISCILIMATIYIIIFHLFFIHICLLNIVLNAW